MHNSTSDNTSLGIPKRHPSFPLNRGGGGEEGPRLTIDVIASLRRHWAAATLVFLVLLGLGAFVIYKKARPVYLSRSVIYVSPKFPKMLSSDSEVERSYDSFFLDQIQTVTRHDIIEDAITKLPYSARKRSGPALPYEIQLMQQKLDVKRVGLTYEMSITLSGPSPDGLADIVNTITDTYVEKTKNEEFYGLDSRLATLRQERDRLQKEMDDRLTEQSKIMQQIGVAGISAVEGATNPYDSELQKLRDQLSSAHQTREAAEAQLAAALKGDGANAAVQESSAEEAIASDSSLTGTRSTLNSRRTALMEEMASLRPDHPIYKKDKDELASIDGMLNDLRSKAGEHLADKLRQEVTRTRMIELQLAKELGEKTHTATSAAPRLQRAAELGPEIDSLTKAHGAINDRIRDLELESNSPGSIHVSTRAMTPLGPERSRSRIFQLALLMFSFLCAVAVAVGIDLLDKRIYTSRDVERVVGFYPLGVLLNRREFRSEITSEYLFRLAAGIDNAVRSSGARTFLFTSPEHGCGTSTIVGELGSILRSLDLRTRTITAPVFEGQETVPDDVAWRSKLLLQRRNKTDEIQTVPITSIEVALHHNDHRKGHEPPAPNPMAEALYQASEQYDVVLIDASPLPISARTEYLARVSDVTILVVRSSVTTKEELDRAARLLERLDVSGVAVVLNRVSMDRADRALQKELLKYEQSFRRRRPTSVEESAPQKKASV